MSDDKHLWSFETNVGSSDAGKCCLRCHRAVVCALLNGVPFCRLCLHAASLAIVAVVEASALGPEVGSS